MKKFLELSYVIVGFINLAFYAWGSHDPASLAAAIACLFCALWRPET